MNTLDACFLEPSDWIWAEHERENRKIRYGYVYPTQKNANINEGQAPQCLIICLQGLSEFCEKYFELAHWALNNNFGFFTFDWMGQGRSTRYLPDTPHKRHSNTFQEDLIDLKNLITTAKKTLPEDIRQKTPLILLGHSTGANLGLRFLEQDNNKIFDFAGFSSPLLGIDGVDKLPVSLAHSLSGFLKTLFPKSYVFGGCDWSESIRTNNKKNVFSSDELRRTIHNYWCKKDPSLQVGSPTFTWLHDAMSSIKYLQNIHHLKNITSPCFFGLAQNDKIVSNTLALKAIEKMPNAHHVILQGAMHEILMEKDCIRSVFLDYIKKSIDKHIP